MIMDDVLKQSIAFSQLVLLERTQTQTVTSKLYCLKRHVHVHVKCVMLL